MLLSLLFWIAFFLAAIGFFAPTAWLPGRYIGGVGSMLLFAIIGLRLFRVPLQ